MSYTSLIQSWPALRELPPDRACLGHDPELWFATDDPYAVQTAKAICGDCAIRDACLGAALSAPEPVAGIWGGLTEDERHRLPRRRGRVAS